MNYWVFNEEQLEKVLAMVKDDPNLTVDDVEAVRAFLYSQVVQELKMLKPAPLSGAPLEDYP